MTQLGKIWDKEFLNRDSHAGMQLPSLKNTHMQLEQHCMFLCQRISEHTKQETSKNCWRDFKWWSWPLVYDMTLGNCK